MPITASKIVEDMPQKDGRRAVRERHTFDDGTYEDVTYLAESKADAKLMLPVRAAQIEAARAEAVASQQADAALTKERAVALLKLQDEDIRAVLKLKAIDEVADAKAELAVEAAV